MIGDDVFGPGEPESRDLGEDLALVGNARAKHVVERGNAVAGNNEQPVAKVVDVADFALAIGRALRDGSVQNGRRERQGDLVPETVGMLPGRRCAINNNI